MVPGVFMPQYARGVGRIEKKKKSLFVTSLSPDNFHKQSPTQLSCHFSSVLQGRAADMRWDRGHRIWSANTLRISLNLLPHVATEVLCDYHKNFPFYCLVLEGSFELSVNKSLKIFCCCPQQDCTPLEEGKTG